MASLFIIANGVISGAVAALTLWACAYGNRWAVKIVVIGFAALVLLSLISVALTGSADPV